MNQELKIKNYGANSHLNIRFRWHGLQIRASEELI